jgi:hypothetical protein
MSPNSLLKQVPIGSFKASQFANCQPDGGEDVMMVDRKGVEEEELKYGERSSSPVVLQEALRLPNVSLRGVAESITGRSQV